MSVTVYTKTGFCGMCMATERALASAGIDYTEIHLEDVDPVQIEEWKTTLGMNAPIVITDTETGSWSGFRPDKIAAVAALVEAANTETGKAA